MYFIVNSLNEYSMSSTEGSWGRREMCTSADSRFLRAATDKHRGTEHSSRADLPLLPPQCMTWGRQQPAVHPRPESQPARQSQAGGVPSCLPPSALPNSAKRAFWVTPKHKISDDSPSPVSSCSGHDCLILPQPLQGREKHRTEQEPRGQERLPCTSQASQWAPTQSTRHL